MSDQHETLVALFDTEGEANAARVALDASDVGVASLELLTGDDLNRLEQLAEVDVGRVATEVATGAGIGAAAVGAGAALLAGVTVLAAAPLAAALVGAGVGASAGAVGAAAASAELRQPAIAALTREALERGLFALLVGVDSEGDALAVQDLLQRSAAMKVIDRHGGQRAS